MVKKFLIIFLSLVLFFGTSFPAFSQDLGDLENQVGQKKEEVGEKQGELSKIQKEISAIQGSSASIEEKLALTNKSIKNVEKYLSQLKADISIRKKELNKKEILLATQKSQLQNLSSYIYRLTRLGVIDYFFLNNSGQSLFKNILYKQYLISSYIEEIKTKKQEYAELASEKAILEKDQKDLNAQMKQLEKMKKDLDTQMNELYGQMAYRNSQSSQLKKEITLLKGEISDLQVAILLAKSGSATGIGNVPSSGDFDATYAGFQQKAPSGYFGIFSFGAYTHRMGMSQYGAQARAEIGNQSYTKILKAYYGTTPVTRKTSGNIKVEGYGAMDFETKYLYGIAEMPSGWHLEALKAQAVAARTYAYSFYYEGKTICATQSCQVWSYDKYVNVMNGQAPKWKQAVDETRKQILSGVVTYYSAITGGYVNPLGWDTTDGKGGSGAWTTNAWESKANSPWFYKSWYTQTYSDASNKCGRKPWMSPTEIADILNTYLVVKGIDVKGSVNTSKILPVTIQTCKISGLSGNPYSMEDMKNLLNNPVVSVSGNPVVQNDGKGNTTKVSFVTNRGAINISGADFKQVFNMRAPGYLSIPQNNYVFVNVVRK